MKKMTKENYIEKIKTLYDDLYELNSEFINFNTKVLIKHKKCGKSFEILPNEFTRSRSTKRFKQDLCPNCRTSIMTKKEALDKLKEITSSKIKMKNEDEFKNTREKVDLICNVCGYEFQQSLHYLYQVKNNKTNSFGCPKCSKKLKKTTEMFKEEVKKISNDEYEVLSEYINTNSKILLKHKKCNKKWYIAPNMFLNKNNRCPYCNESKGEKIIYDYLNKNNIKFISQYSFERCKYKYRLKFDFYLEDYNLCIEYDGIQHFNENNIFSKNNKENFKISRERDLIKNKFCKDNKINLIRLHYKLNKNEIENIINIIINNKFNIETSKKYNLYTYFEDDIILNENSYYNIK